MNDFKALQICTGLVPIATKLPGVHQFDNAISPLLCAAAVQHGMNAAREEVEAIAWQDCKDVRLKANLYGCRVLFTLIASHCYQSVVYPARTELVMWREGRCQDAHVGADFPVLANQIPGSRIRRFCAIAYLNDDFTGGEAYLRDANGETHVHIPKVGSVLFFEPGETLALGVNAVTSGARFTLPVWFTDHAALCERTVGFVDPAAVNGLTPARKTA